VNLTKKVVLADLITQGEDYFAYRVIHASNISHLVHRESLGCLRAFPLDKILVLD
jgi:hypothetical protein